MGLLLGEGGGILPFLCLCLEASEVDIEENRRTARAAKTTKRIFINLIR